MMVDIITSPLLLNVYGFSGTALNKDYAGTAFRLMDRTWKLVKENNLKNKGKNIWIYEPNDLVFAGVELEEEPVTGIGLDQKAISLLKYAYCKHVGPYSLIKQTGQAMIDELERKGFEIDLPYIEIYGHWTKDETKLETELLRKLK